MSTFLDSNKVKVFPSSLRSAQNGDQSAGKYTSEKNLTGIIKTLANKDSFIINWGDSSAELVIGGYYFNLTALPDMPTAGDYYAGIRLDSAERLCSLTDGGPDLDPENGSSFYGLGFSSLYTDFPSAYLQIVEDGQLCKKSFHKFNSETIFFDGGWGKSLAELFDSDDILKVEAGGTGVSAMTPGWALVAGGEATTDPSVTTTEPITFRQITNHITAETAANLREDSYNLINETTLYHCLPNINNDRPTSSMEIYAPTNYGVANSLLVAQGDYKAPMWKEPKIAGSLALTDLTVSGGTSISGSYLASNIKFENNTTTIDNSTFYKVQVDNIRVGGLLTGRTLKVALGSTSASTAFDGTQSISDIGVSGILAVANGGTGRAALTGSNSLRNDLGLGTEDGALAVANGGTGVTSIANIKSGKDGSGNTITSTYLSKVSTSSQSMAGILVANNNTSYTTGQMRNVILSTSSTATDGGNGDIWITYVD